MTHDTLRAAAEALKELVACQNLKHAMLSARADPYYLTQADAMESEYERRKPLAWQRAREALSALAQEPPAAAPAQGERCAMCDGAGTIRATTSHLGPDDYDYDAECPACEGTGSSDIRDAINALPYSLHRARHGVQVVERAAVLRIVEARAALPHPPTEGSKTE